MISKRGEFCKRDILIMGFDLKYKAAPKKILVHLFAITLLSNVRS
jgi:hypothetical protein